MLRLVAFPLLLVSLAIAVRVDDRASLRLARSSHSSAFQLLKCASSLRSPHPHLQMCAAGGPSLSMSMRLNSMVNGYDNSAKSLDLSVKRAEIAVRLAEREELYLSTEMEIRELETEKRAAREKELWDSLLQAVAADVQTDDDCRPWEIDPSLEGLIEDILSSKERELAPYASIALGENDTLTGVDIVGSMEEMDSSSLRQQFTDAIEEQKEKAPAAPRRTAWGLLGGIDAQGGSSTAWRRDGVRTRKEEVFEQQRKRFEAGLSRQRALLRERSEWFAQREWEAGRSPRNGHRVPWETVVQRMELLQGAILRERAELEQAALPEEGDEAGWSGDKDKVLEALRMPKGADFSPFSSAVPPSSASSSSGGSNLRLEKSASSRDEDELAAMQEELGVSNAEEAQVVTVLRENLDSELRAFQDNVAAVQFATEELLRDAQRWRKAEEGALPFSSVQEFRAHVKEQLQEFLSEKEVEAIDTSSLQAFREQQSLLLGSTFPWRHLETLWLPREEAVELLLASRGYSTAPVSLSEEDLIEREGEWAEYEEVAESYWRVFEPEQYSRYQRLKSRRVRLLERELERDRVIALVGTQATMALEEFEGVLIALQLHDGDKELDVASSFVSPLSGKGSELGLEPQAETVLQFVLAGVYLWLMVAPWSPTSGYVDWDIQPPNLGQYAWIPDTLQWAWHVAVRGLQGCLDGKCDV